MVRAVRNDVLGDPRFAGNLLVTGSSGLCFYAGVLLEMEGGHKAGTLAVLDRRPRRLTPTQRRDRALLARQVGVLLPLMEEAVRLVASPLPATAAIDVIRPADEIWIDADKGQLQQLVIKLCANAWLALPDGEGCIEVGQAARLMAT